MATIRFAVCAGGLDTPAQAAASLAAQGVEAIETGPPELILNATPARLREAARIFHDAGVWVRSVHAPFGKEHNLSSPDPAIRQRSIETHKRLLGQCAHLGVYCAVVHSGTSENPELLPQMDEWIIQSLRAIAPAAEESGVRIALENLLPNHPGTHAQHLNATLDAVGSPALGICFDSGHAHVNGAMADIFEQVKSRVITFHIHDNDGKRDLHFQPPYGTINWEDFLRVYRTMNFAHPVTIEAAPWAKGTYGRMLGEVSRLMTQFEERIAEAERQAAQKSGN